MAMKKAVFFTLDALIASGIIITAVILVGNFYSYEQQKVNVNYASQDLVRVFSSLTVGQVDNAYVKALILKGDLTSTNSTILEQIGDLWMQNELNLSYNLTRNLSEDIIPGNYGFSLLVNGEEIYSRDIPVKKTLVSSRKMISGIAKTASSESSTARVLLSGIKSKKTNAYVYFGGYEGDGNLTKRFMLPKDVIKFNSSYLEVDAGGNFNLYINNVLSGNFVKGSSGGGDMLADKWNISNAYLANFKAGENTISINFTSGSSYIAGGFLRVAYITSSYNDTQTAGYEKYMIPGIDGAINLYSSVYIPNSLNNMVVFLNYSSNYTTFLRLGNVTVYEGKTNGTAKNVTLTNSTLRTLLNYNSLSQKTIPLRIGITNATTIGGNGDAVLVSDVSGSMEFCSKATSYSWNGWVEDSNKGCFYWSGSWLWGTYGLMPSGSVEYNRTTWNDGTNNLCGCRYHPICGNDVTKLDLYKNSSNKFIDIFLNNSGNKAGLVDFSGSNPSSVYIGTCSPVSSTIALFPDSIVRTNNLVTGSSEIQSKINSTEAWWGTCTCCGINKAVEMLNSQSTPFRKKFIVLMSDGEATVECTQQPNSTAIADAVQSAWDACNNGISVYAIAFGNDANPDNLKRMNCSGGKFFNATNTTKLEEVYNEIAGDIKKLSSVEQTINATGLAKSVIYPDSYIEFNYTASDIQFNKIPLSFESERFGNNISSGTLTIYANTSVLDAKVTSYSGAKWTDKLVVNSNTIYKLSDFGEDYHLLGDPFAVNIPIGSINEGSNNILISTGTNATTNTGGSNDSRVIYTLLLNGFADYSNVAAKADGCSWAISFEDGTSSTIKVPSNYNGADVCSFLTKTYDANDALDNAAYSLFSNLDIDKDGKLDVNIDEASLNINVLTISKVPSLWGPAIIEIRVWE